MASRNCTIILLLAGIFFLGSCASNKVTTAKYYYQHEKAIVNIEQLYKNLYQIKPFSVQFTDKSFNFISVEIITDSLKYMYEFGINEPRLVDTLLKFKLPVDGIKNLIQQMQLVHCTWINNLDYYTNSQKNRMVFMSMWPVPVQLPIGREKYFILTFYQQPQYFDSNGMLLASRRLRRLRKINGEIFRRINDKVCYTISERFR